MLCARAGTLGQAALATRKGRLWRSKEQLLRENGTLFWNLVWWYAALGLPFEQPALVQLANKPGVAAFVARLDGEACGPPGKGGGGGGDARCHLHGPSGTAHR